MPVDKATTLYFKKLDSLRFLAFMLVFLSHGFHNFIESLDLTQPGYLQVLEIAGSVGVRIFFVISGFLITYLLIREKELIGKVSIKNFYVRRILRIWPLYYLVVISGMYILPFLFGTFEFHGNEVLNLTFLNNFDMENILRTPNIGIVWSVAIEEQFYVVWPLIFVIVGKSRKLLVAVGIILLIFSGWFIVTHKVGSHFHTFGNMIYLMSGCVGAIIYKVYNLHVKNSVLVNRWFAFSVVLVILALMIIQPTGWVLISPIFYLLLVIYSVASDVESTRLSVFSKLGKYTYGMYMYHPTVILIVKISLDKLGVNYVNKPLFSFALGCISLAITMVLAIGSYDYFEKPFLKLKSKFSKVPTRV